jgi:hypothetical protein
VAATAAAGSAEAGLVEAGCTITEAWHTAVRSDPRATTAAHRTWEEVGCTRNAPRQQSSVLLHARSNAAKSCYAHLGGGDGGGGEGGGGDGGGGLQCQRRRTEQSAATTERQADAAQRAWAAADCSRSAERQSSAPVCTQSEAVKLLHAPRRRRRRWRRRRRRRRRRRAAMSEARHRAVSSDH